MKILVIHNSYQIAGGEDSVFNNECLLLEQNGITVRKLSISNDSISGLLAKVFAFIGVVFSFHGYKRIVQAIETFRPDVVHVHNYFPLISPSVFYACKKMGVPVVHTLHNYRAICPTALLMNNGKIEERSIQKSPWWAVKQKVYKDSILGTFVLAAMVAWHKRLGTWKTKVDRFIALTQFAANKYEQAGWPESKLVVKPNFVPDPFDSGFTYQNEQHAIFVGRLSEEKGVDLLLEAWKEIDYKLLIIGDGPLKSVVEQSDNPNIHYLGKLDKQNVLERVKKASFLVMASTWYEGLPMVLVEAFACGTPALVPNLGGMGEVVKDKVTGLHLEPGNSSDLSKKAEWLFEHPEAQKKFSINARNEYLDRYTPEQNYEMLMDIYQQAIAETNYE